MLIKTRRLIRVFLFSRDGRGAGRADRANAIISDYLSLAKNKIANFKRGSIAIIFLQNAKEI